MAAVFVWVTADDEASLQVFAARRALARALGVEPSPAGDAPPPPPLGQATRELCAAVCAWAAWLAGPRGAARANAWTSALGLPPGRVAQIGAWVASVRGTRLPCLTLEGELEVLVHAVARDRPQTPVARSA